MSLSQHLLAAAPELIDPNFRETVVLVVEHNSEGAFGLVLNRPFPKTLAEIWAMVGESGCTRSEPLMQGGPVEGPLMALHGVAEWGEAPVLPGVYLSSRKELLDKLVKSEEPLRVFAGYSGWAAGQLERELEVGGWLTAGATRDDIFDDPSLLWRRVLDRIVQQIMEPVWKGRAVPTDCCWWN